MCYEMYIYTHIYVQYVIYVYRTGGSLGGKGCYGLINFVLVLLAHVQDILSGFPPVHVKVKSQNAHSLSFARTDHQVMEG